MPRILTIETEDGAKLYYTELSDSEVITALNNMLDLEYVDNTDLFSDFVNYVRDECSDVYNIDLTEDSDVPVLEVDYV